jgi:hypothetical protein
MEIMKITQLREIIREEIKSINELSASVIRNKLLKQFGDDPLYKDFIIAKTSKEQKKALATLKSIRGGNAVRLMQKYVKKLQGESINEGKLDRISSHLIKDLDKKFKGKKSTTSTFNKIKKELKRKMPGVSDMVAGSIANQYNDFLLDKDLDWKYAEKIRLMAGTLKRLGMKESVNEDIVRGNEVHAKTKKELKAAIARSMKEILNGKTPKYDIINGMSGEMIGWKDGNDYIWQPNAIPYAERELK